MSNRVRYIVRGVALKDWLDRDRLVHFESQRPLLARGWRGLCDGEPHGHVVEASFDATSGEFSAGVQLSEAGYQHMLSLGPVAKLEATIVEGAMARKKAKRTKATSRSRTARKNARVKPKRRYLYAALRKDTMEVVLDGRGYPCMGLSSAEAREHAVSDAVPPLSTDEMKIKRAVFEWAARPGGD
jgi:hypothetical protein